MPRIYFTDQQMRKLKLLCEADRDLLAVIEGRAGLAKPSLPFITFIQISILIVLSLLIAFSFYQGYTHIALFLLIMAIPYVVFTGWNRNVGSISLILFFTAPFSIASSLLLPMVIWFPDAPPWLFITYICVSIPLSAGILFVMFKQHYHFMGKANVSLNINYFVFFGLVVSVGIYALYENDYSLLLPLVDGELLLASDFEPTALFIHLCRLIALPFIVTMALLKALLAYYRYQEKEKLNRDC